MGRASREKWMKRAEVYEHLTLRANAEGSKVFLERFSERKLKKLIKGAQDLEAERDAVAEEAGPDEPEG